MPYSHPQPDCFVSASVTRGVQTIFSTFVETEAVFGEETFGTTLTVFALKNGRHVTEKGSDWRCIFACVC